MFWLHRLQQRLSLTKNEAITLLTVAGLFAAGVIVRYVQQQSVPVASDAYEEIDSLFFAGVAEVRENSARDPASRLEVGPVPEGTSAGAQIEVHPREGAARARVDINRAGIPELDELPRIGPAIAQRIIDFRDRFGPFRSVDDLLQVRGIGAKTLEALRPLVAVESDSAGDGAKATGR